MFRALVSANFPPFSEFKLRLPEVPDRPQDLGEVHLFSGVNGTGKTRILSLLAAMLGNTEHIARRMPDTGSYEVAVYDRDPGANPIPPSAQPRISCSRSGVGWSHITVPLQQWLTSVAAFAYSGEAYISDTAVQAVAAVKPPERARSLAFTRAPDQSGPVLQALTNMKVQSAIESMNRTEGRSLRIITAVEKAISDTTGRAFFFTVSGYQSPRLEVSWGGTTLPFNLLPDGLRSIIGMVGHTVMMTDVQLQGSKDPLAEPMVLLLDEVETHLHPAWQRKLLPMFQRLFPRAQIFIATHSPFVITSLNYGWIHVLAPSPDGKVTIQAPKRASKGDSYVSVIEEIMGIPEMFDTETENLLTEFRKARDLALAGSDGDTQKALDLAAKIGARSVELNFMMGREVAQLTKR